MGELLIVIGVVVVVVAVIVIAVRAARRRQPTAPAARRDPLAADQPVHGFGPRNLGPGAIVAYGGVDYVVRGTITLREGSFVWWEHLLDGGDGAQWLGVEEDEGQLDLTWWTTRKGLGVSPGPEVVVDGSAHREVEAGQARYSTEGTTGLAAQGSVRYRDYRTGNGGALLSFEDWDGAGWDASTGRPLSPGELTVYPAPPASGDPGYTP